MALPHCEARGSDQVFCYLEDDHPALPPLIDQSPGSCFFGKVFSWCLNLLVLLLRTLNRYRGVAPTPIAERDRHDWGQAPTCPPYYLSGPTIWTNGASPPHHTPYYLSGPTIWTNGASPPHHTREFDPAPQIREFAHSKIDKITHTNVKKPFPSEVTTKTRLWLGVHRHAYRASGRRDPPGVDHCRPFI